jgi:tetratricopeptide (TPR) repeat protein/TolB-like protein
VGRILIYLALVLTGTAQARADSSTVLVFPFENASSDRTLDWIGEGISELIIERLQPEAGVYVFSRDERVAAYEKLGIPETTQVSRATALKIGWDVGADVVITGRFSGTQDNFQIAARLVDMESGSAKEISAEGKLQDVIPLSMSVAWQLLKKMVPGTESPEFDYIGRPPTPRSAFENYIRGILNQDLMKRIEQLQTAIRLHPQYGPALLQLGRTYFLERDFKNSSQWLQKIPETSFLRRQAQFLIGLNNFYIGDYPAAITTFQALPQTYDVLLNLGAAFSEKGDSAAATAAWKHATEIDPLASDAFFDMGYASFLKGDFEIAAKYLTESLKLRSRDSEALFLLGRTYEKLGRLDESQKTIAQATRLSQRVERWLNQPLPRLYRLAASTVFRSHDDTWTQPRLARRARGQDLAAWLESIQTDVDSYLFGDALRELQDVLRVFPQSAEARSLLDEVHRQQSLVK